MVLTTVPRTVQHERWRPRHDYQHDERLLHLSPAQVYHHVSLAPASPKYTTQHLVGGVSVAEFGLTPGRGGCCMPTLSLQRTKKTKAAWRSAILTRPWQTTD
jgi:hypothetical protein